MLLTCIHLQNLIHLVHILQKLMMMMFTFPLLYDDDDDDEKAINDEKNEDSEILVEKIH